MASKSNTQASTVAAETTATQEPIGTLGEIGPALESVFSQAEIDELANAIKDTYQTTKPILVSAGRATNGHNMDREMSIAVWPDGTPLSRVIRDTVKYLGGFLPRLEAGDVTCRDSVRSTSGSPIEHDAGSARMGAITCIKAVANATRSRKIAVSLTQREAGKAEACAELYRDDMGLSWEDARDRLGKRYSEQAVLHAIAQVYRVTRESVSVGMAAE